MFDNGKLYNTYAIGCVHQRAGTIAFLCVDAHNEPYIGNMEDAKTFEDYGAVKEYAKNLYIEIGEESLIKCLGGHVPFGFYNIAPTFLEKI
jgi:hypothetical protein